MSRMLSTLVVGVAFALGCGSNESATPTRTAAADASRIHVAAIPRGQPLNHDFSARARVPGGRWQPLGLYRADVDFLEPSQVAVAKLEASGPVQIAITRAGGTMRTARVRPARYGVRPVVSRDGRTATFTLPRPLDVSFEPDGDTHHNVHVFVDRLARERARGRTISFGPGIHEIPGDHVVRVPGNTTLELAAGAVLRGAIEVTGSHATIQGHGVIDPSPVFAPEEAPPTIAIEHHADVGVRDVTILDSAAGGILVLDARRVTIAGVRMINAARWTDGVDVVAGSRDVLVQDAFLRTADDSVAVYASTLWGDRGSTYDVTVRDSVLWPDVAHAVNIGTHGDPDGSDRIARLLFSDLDVLEHDESNERYQGALAVNAGDGVAASDIQFEDVRIDRISVGRMLDVRVFLNPDYNRVPGAGVHDVLFRNVTYGGTADKASRIAGYSRGRSVRGVTLENVRRGGHLLGRRDVAVGEHVGRLAFRGRVATRQLDDDAASIRYRGRWRVEPSAGARGGTVHATASAGAVAIVTFRGRRARVYGELSPGGGVANVQVGRGLRRDVDTYATVVRPGRLWLDSGPLPPGRHTLRIRSTASRDRLSAGRRIALDRVEVVP